MVDGLGKSDRFGLGDREMRLLMVLLLAAPCAAGPPVEIKLDSILSNGTHGTVDLRETPEAPLAREIWQVINDFEAAESTENPPKSFLVSGHGAESVRGAHRVLVGKQEPEQTFIEGKKCSLVFYARVSSLFAKVERVAVGNGVIKVEYSAVPQLTKGFASYLAIIPLPTLPAGDWRVDTIAKPLPDYMARNPDGVATFNAAIDRYFAHGCDFHVKAQAWDDKAVPDPK